MLIQDIRTDSFDYEQQDLNNSVFVRCFINKVNMQRCNLTDATFDRCRFIRLDVSGSTLKNTMFKNCTFMNANFADADVRRSSFSNVTIDNINSNVTNWSSVEFQNCEFQGKFINSRLTDVSAIGSLFDYCSFRSCEILKMVVTSSSFNYCNFTSTIINNSTFVDSKFDQIGMDSFSKFEMSRFENVSFDDATIIPENWVRNEGDLDWETTRWVSEAIESEDYELLYSRSEQFRPIMQQILKDVVRNTFKEYVEKKFEIPAAALFNQSADPSVSQDQRQALVDRAQVLIEQARSITMNVLLSFPSVEYATQENRLLISECNNDTDPATLDPFETDETQRSTTLARVQVPNTNPPKYHCMERTTLNNHIASIGYVARNPLTNELLNPYSIEPIP